MKTFYSLSATFALFFISAFSSHACDNSSFTLNSHTDLGGGLHEYTVTFCVGSGQSNGQYGGSGQTGLWAVRLDGGASFVSYPATLTSPNTGAVYGADNVTYGPDFLLYDVISWPSNSPFLFPGAWTCLEGNCGPATSTCVTFTYVTNGEPTTMTLMGAEAAGVGVPPYGCNGDPDMVINLQGLTVDAGNTAYYCTGGCTTLNATVSGGTAPYTYSWQTIYGGGNAGSAASITVCPTTNELYLLTVTDNNGLSSSDYVSVIVYQPPVVNAGADQSKYLGYGPSCVTLSGNANGSMNPYTYQWSNGATTASTSVCPSVTTNYTLTATDARGCSASDVVTVTVTDIRCGNNKVKMCRNGRNYCISTNQVPQKLNQGYTLGQCGSNKNEEDLFEELIEEETTSLIFPNPASTEATVNYTFTEDATVTISVYDVSGKLIKPVVTNKSVSAGIQNTEKISVEELPSGFYFVRISATNGEQIMHKLLISR